MRLLLLTGVVWASEPARIGDETTFFPTQNPLRTLIAQTPQAEIPVSRLGESRGHGQYPA